MIKRLILLVIFILFISGSVFWYKYNYSINKSSNKIKVSFSTSHSLSTKEFEKINEELSSVVQKQNPRAALALLATDAKKDNAIAASCHLLAHEVGHVAFKKYKNFGNAMLYQNEICNSGYMHGVIESYFSNTKSVTSAMTTICDQYHMGSFASWECFHGVGHGLMFYNGNNVPLSLVSCSIYKNTFSSEACTNGVFMENFNTDQKIHPSQYLRASNPFYPCYEELDKYKPDCYLYAPVYYLQLHKNAYKDALSWCLTATPDFQNACTEGVGSEAMKENINNPKLVEELCMEGKDAQKSLCISGMVGLYINNFGSLDQVRILCNQMGPENKSTCESIIKNERPMFEM